MFAVFPLLNGSGFHALGFHFLQKFKKKKKNGLQFLGFHFGRTFCQSGMPFLALWEPKSSKLVLYKNAWLFWLFWLFFGSLTKLALLWLFMCFSLTKVTTLAPDIYQFDLYHLKKKKKMLSRIYCLTNLMSFSKIRGVRFFGSLILFFLNILALLFLDFWLFEIFFRSIPVWRHLDNWILRLFNSFSVVWQLNKEYLHVLVFFFCLSYRINEQQSFIYLRSHFTTLLSV